MLRLTTQLHLSSELGPFQGEDFRILTKFGQNRVIFQGGNLLQNDRIFIKIWTSWHEKIKCHRKVYFFPKTYLNSSLNTKYECLTRKTERDSLKNDLKIHDFHHFSLRQVQLWLTKESSENDRIPDWFLKLSRSVFRVRPSYLVCRELFKYVFDKNKHFCGKIFFRVERSIFDEKSVILKEISTLEYHLILTKFGQHPEIVTLKWT